MAYQTRDRAPLLDSHTQAALERRGKELLGLGLLGAGLLAVVMLATYSPEDPNWLLASDAPTQNWLGRFGASIAHPLMMIVGRAAWGVPLAFLAWGFRLATHRAEERARSVFAPIFVAVLSAAFATMPAGEGWTQGYGPGGLFGDTALGFLLTVIPLGDLLVSLLVWAGAVALGLFALGVTKAEIRASRQAAALGMVLGYAWALRTGARGLLHALDGYEAVRARAAEAAAARAERAAAERARLEEEERAIRAIPAPEERPAFDPGLPPASRATILRATAPGPVPSRSHLMPPPLVGGSAPVDTTDWDESEEPAFMDGFDDLAALEDPDDLEAEFWAEPAEPVEAPLAPIPPAPAFLKTPAPDHAPVAPSRLPAQGLLTSLLRRVRHEPEPQAEEEPDEPSVDDVRIRARIGDAIRARIESPRAEPPVETRTVPLPRPIPEAPAPTLRAEPLRGVPHPAPRAIVADREPVVEAVVEAPAAPVRRPAPKPAAAPARPVPKAPAPMAYASPPLDLLADPSEVQRHHLSDAALSENARSLEQVLDDFGVKGEITSVRPGPVVTMYELEPAPGLKASRVIGLADDIARNMSALSARVSTVPGRNVIGIELPNDRREKVVLREILSAPAFEDGQQRLPLALGKDIGGEPVVANLAKMPHLLIAGTTGSGKSVAINTMILSLLYKLTPEECRLIMIDPKMLELSVYDGIPHLLSPVVTDPKKAVVALKWVVGEMEERYRKMSKMGVRNIEGYNGRVRDALERGEMFSRTVQTGFDDETGDPVFETDEFMPEILPFIVVVVDEMADLMMVAGKEIEACIQRLAQMARASGIHIIMATQRPSVDVITGTIKANFPTRISFQVTSKIDSRTILGEQGAEQLLGQGDMLYMAGGGRITRIHGPFCSDEEVEEIVTFLKGFGPPSYVGAVLEEQPEAGDGPDPALPSGGETEDALYDMAVQIVAKDRKCSTSYIQRKLAIGYNKAARLVEQMEEQGVVTPANHVGKREILVPEPH
ncbi:Cell division protein FtsK [Rubellimicrobium mesophilum DSM 19309]|uniref:DNA translocase FtsK n=1 Tax=Rubellimicrobium mesophilum DSM 19309 TaxID=442562 RepID=A0A017HK27_9RHOB|nr:DNA translocase FtsK [Rubellimicrobium mesophilum]EYD74711.1 Cell division protein FtsK [Rubellimicrobium mesophilum DSM 19309]